MLCVIRELEKGGMKESRRALNKIATLVADDRMKVETEKRWYQT